MARTIQNNLPTEELIQHLDVLGENATYITHLIGSNWGKDPIKYRRARTIVEKITELRNLVLED